MLSGKQSLFSKFCFVSHIRLMNKLQYIRHYTVQTFWKDMLMKLIPFLTFSITQPMFIKTWSVFHVPYYSKQFRILEIQVFGGIQIYKYETLCTIWCDLCNLKNEKNTHGGVLILIKLQTETCNFTKSDTPACLFFPFLNYKNGTKSFKASLI